MLVTLNVHLTAGIRAAAERLPSKSFVVTIHHDGDHLHLHLPTDNATAAEVAMELIDALQTIRSWSLRAAAGQSHADAEATARRVLDEGLDAPEHVDHDLHGSFPGCPRCEYDAILGERQDQARSRDL